MRPSFLAHVVNGLILAIGLVYAGYYLWTNYAFMSNLEVGQLLLLVSIAIGVHGLLHFYEEIYFDYNPLVGALTIHDQPIRS